METKLQSKQNVVVQNLKSSPLNGENIGRLKKKIKNIFASVTFGTVKVPGKDILKLEVKFNSRETKRVKGALDDLALDYKETSVGVIEVLGFWPKAKPVVKTVLSDTPDVPVEQAEEPEVPEVSEEEVSVERKFEMPEVAKDLLSVFNISEKNILECDQDILRLKFDISGRTLDKLKFTELLLFCSLINGDGNAFIVDQESGEIIVECQKLRIPNSNTFRPIRKKAIECLMEENGVFFSPKNGNLDGKVRYDDVSMRMVLNFKSDKISFLDQFKKRLQESGFRLSFVNENAQSILIINYRFVEKSVAYFELIERSEPGYLKGRFLGELKLKPQTFYVNDGMWFVDLGRGINHEEEAKKLMEAGYKYITANKKYLMLPSLNPVSNQIMPREIPDSQKNRYPEEEKIPVPVVRTILQKQSKTAEEEKLTAIARIARLMKGLTEDEAHKLIDKFEDVISGKKLEAKQVSVKTEKDPVEERRSLKRLIHQITESGRLVVIDKTEPFGVPYNNVKMLAGNRWKVNPETVKSLSPTEILRILGITD